MNKGNFLSDPKGLIFEAYNIEDISEPECRSIFLDWALSLDSKFDPMEEIRNYLKYYREITPNHPMNSVLLEGLEVKARRGLRRANKLKFPQRN